MSDVLELPGHTSFSQVTSYAACPERYRLERIVEFPQQAQGHFIGGGAVHECIEEAYRTGQSPASLAPMFEALMTSRVAEAGGEAAVRWAGRKTKAFPNGEDLSWWLIEGPKMLARAGEVMVAHAEAGYEVAHVEDEFVFDAEKLVRARPDVVLRNGDGFVCVDWKTGAMKPATGGIQLAIYAMALRAAYGSTEAVRGQVVMLRKDGDDRVISVDPLIYEPVAVRMIRDFVVGTTAGLFPMAPGVMCSSCTVRAGCEFGMTLANGTEEE